MCPVCGGDVVDIIYGSGDMTDTQFFHEYRRIGVMGGDTIPKNPPLWACAAGCKRFRKINWEGSATEVKPKLLKNVRKRPLSIFQFESESANCINNKGTGVVHKYIFHTQTYLGEKEDIHISAKDKDDAFKTFEDIVAKGIFNLKGMDCISVDVTEEE
jgi:hypothetical protein